MLSIRTSGPDRTRFAGFTGMGGGRSRFAGCAAVANRRSQLMQYFRTLGGTVAWYQPGVGITGTLNASAWANQLGAAGVLAQADANAQPIILPWDGSKYIYLPAAASNTVTTPTKTITGNFAASLVIALNDYTPAADVTLLDKSSGNNGFTVKWLTTDKIRLVIGDGAALTNVDASVASGLTDGSKHTIGIVWTDGVGASFTIDGVAWGTAVAAVKTLTNAAVSLTLGSTTSIGRVYDLTITNSVATTYYHLNPNAAVETVTNAATWVSDNGETYTLNNTGVKPAQVVGSAQLLFDAAAYFMSASFTLNQPLTLYLVAEQVTWTLNNRVFDGKSILTFFLQQNASTPELRLVATGALASDANMALGAHGIITCVSNGASSVMQTNQNTAVTGDVGAGNPAGFSIGASDNAGVFNTGANIQVKEIILRNVADSAATRLNVQQMLKAIHRTP